MAQLGDVFLQLSPEALRLLMEQQMREAQDISNIVPRGKPGWAPSALPELPFYYQPPERYNYGRPVRLG